MVITTGEGADRVRLELLSEDKAWFHHLIQEYQLPDIHFDEGDIRVIRDEKGQISSDIRTPRQNSQIADQIVEIVQGLAQDNDSAIHASIAGGRKTMGFYLGYAMSLCGRPQDRLSHVLVEEDFEGNSEFFYPSSKSKTIYGRDGKPLDASRARVMLADIPFVRLRDGLPEQLLSGRASFSEIVNAAQRLYGEISLKINPLARCIECAGVPVELTTTEMAFYLFMAHRVLDGKPAVRWDDEGWKANYLYAYRCLVSEYSAEYEKFEEVRMLLEKADPEDEKNYFEQRKSRTNSALKTKLGKKLAEPYLIQRSGLRGRSRYGINIDADAIELMNGH